MHLGWELLNLDQTPVELGGDPVTFDGRQAGGKVEIGVNSVRKAELPLSLDDPVRDLITPLDKLLRVRLYGDSWSEIIFQGKIIPESSGSAEGGVVSVSAVDPLAQLNALLIRSASIVGGKEIWDVVKLGQSFILFPNSAQSDIVWGLVSSVTGHGVKKGTLAPEAPSMEMEYEAGGSIGETITQLCELAGSIDFELVPVEASDGTICELNTYYPHQGTDKTSTVKFVYGAAPESAVAFTHSPGGEIVNRVIFLSVLAGLGGSNDATSAIYENKDSIEAYGPYEQIVDMHSVTAAGLGAWFQSGRQLIATKAFPIDYFSVTPAPELVDGGDPDGFGVPPVFGPGPDADYWVGDTIAVEAHRPGDAEPLALEGRITDATLTETASGQLTVSIDCAPEPSDTDITERPLEIRVPNADGEAAAEP